MKILFFFILSSLTAYNLLNLLFLFLLRLLFLLSLIIYKWAWYVIVYFNTNLNSDDSWNYSFILLHLLQGNISNVLTFKSKLTYIRECNHLTLLCGLVQLCCSIYIWKCTLLNYGSLLCLLLISVRTWKWQKPSLTPGSQPGTQCSTSFSPMAH